MTKTTTNLLGILITILAGTYFYICMCSECGTSPVEEIAPVVEEVIPEATSNPFAFNDGDYSYNVNDNFNFDASSSTILTPISTNIEDGIESLKSFFTENANKVINITGFYKDDETNGSAFPNLGLARANSVKNYLVSKGLSSSQMNIFGEEMDNMVPKNNTYLGPITYSLDNKSEDAENQLQALYDKIKANPLVLYFETGEASINLTPEQRQKVADISRYLDKVEGSSAKVVGHTDNTGSRTTNINLGQGRADFAKAYLSQNGISEAKIVTSSEGPDSPVASNSTEEGRSKNRRTVVTLN
ncbi:outer membrane protein OmpA-like peptidoglycan-associated protein [Saonia flava]|uniref:Outer membrane protein OmpA-like peptidoglycan-associated protein n=1 Tax=Saonia flava TaxID=523696 RepID=A0A846QYJ2_9FLAO|nr:OmpA family protein [Saonia flava]NJB71283.1 outer membrane protein OmpA-like peptidoglycan-associated protein [Saonia flava]